MDAPKLRTRVETVDVEVSLLGWSQLRGANDASKADSVLPLRVSRRLAYPLLLAVAALYAYGNSYAGRFVFDDFEHIVDNPQIRSTWPIWAPLFHTSRPIVQWSLALNYAISGLSPWSYHLLNVLVHFAASCALLGVLRRILRRERRWRIARAADGLAFTVALLWLVHPLQTESVTYVIQRGESLMGLFCLLTLYAFVRSLESAGRAAVWRARA